MLTLKSFYADRAERAFDLEQAVRDGQSRDAQALERFKALCIELAQQEKAWMADHAAPPAAPLTPDWCTLCGSATRKKLGGHLLCVACEMEPPQAPLVDYLTTETEL